MHFKERVRVDVLKEVCACGAWASYFVAREGERRGTRRRPAGRWNKSRSGGYSCAMAIDPRAALDGLIGALEAFHQAATNAQDPDADSVVEASDALADAYTLYDDVMFTRYEIEAPLDVYFADEDVDDEFEDFDDDVVLIDDDDVLIVDDDVDPDNLDSDDFDDDDIVDLDESDLEGPDYL